MVFQTRTIDSFILSAPNYSNIEKLLFFSYFSSIDTGLTDFEVYAAHKHTAYAYTTPLFLCTQYKCFIVNI